MYEEPAYGSPNISKVEHLRDVIPGPKPCSKYTARNFNKLLKLRADIGGRQPTKWAHRPVCIRPHVRRLQAQINRLLRICRDRGDPGCRWFRAWKRLSAYDRRWAIAISSCEVRAVWPDLDRAAGFDSSNGFYGAFQFVLSTWHKAGGSSSPTDASWHEQAVRAVRWRNRAGTMQWPACSRTRGYA